MSNESKTNKLIILLAALFVVVIFHKLHTILLTNQLSIFH
jgi:hypothetical protein